MKNWKTTALGVATILAALSDAAKLLLDGDSATNPNWNTVLAAVLAGIGLINAKDWNVTGGTIAATSEAAKRV